jgi:hypothetical protein
VSYSPTYRPSAKREPIALPITDGAPWMIGAVVFALLVYYFVGIDQGATSVFGNDFHIHEYVHDARHFLGFPCH